MRTRSVDHIGIAVRKIDDALAFWEDCLGFECTGRETVPEHGTTTAFLNTKGTQLELIEPTDETSPVARFLERRGEGIHHISIRVDDIDSAVEHARSRGLEVVSEHPRIGTNGARIAFIHPRSSGGVLLELCQR